MPTQQGMKRRIERTEDLQSVVGTMKALAAVSIRQYERAVESVDEYNRTIELGLRIVLAKLAPRPNLPRRGVGGHAAVLIGSDQGMCGQFNEDIFSFARRVRDEEAPGQDWRVVTVGERVASLLSSSDGSVLRRFSTPSSAAGVSTVVQGILSVLGDIEGLDVVLVFHNRHRSSASYDPNVRRLLPLDDRWIEEFRSSSWPTNRLPSFSVDRDRLFAFLIRQYLFVSLYRAVAHSLAAENASRLAAMQVAEKNIEERLAGLTSDYHRERQSTITEELLDIVSGFEALTG